MGTQLSLGMGSAAGRQIQAQVMSYLGPQSLWYLYTCSFSSSCIRAFCQIILQHLGLPLYKETKKQSESTQVETLVHDSLYRFIVSGLTRQCLDTVWGIAWASDCYYKAVWMKPPFFSSGREFSSICIYICTHYIDIFSHMSVCVATSLTWDFFAS